METTNIIAILMFIIPGVIAEKISNRMDMPSAQNKSEFGELINGILLSIPIVIIVGFILSICKGLATITDFITEFNNIGFLLIFVVLTIILAVIIGMAKGLFKDKTIKLVNLFRRKIKKIDIDDKSCWRHTFLEDNKSKYVEIIVDGKPYKGYVDHYSLPNEEKEIVIHTPEEWKYYPEAESKFTKVNKVYINIEKSIVIKDYDTSEYEKWLKKLNNKNEV